MVRTSCGRAAVALLAVLAVACSGTDTAATSPPSSLSTLADFSKQRISWAGCADGLECAGIRVPIDYAHPAGGTTTIRLNRLPATGDSRGPLLLNPGGPGGSGIQLVAEDANAFRGLRAAYDLVGFDPRGVGSSDPVRCLSTADLDELTAEDLPPRTAVDAARRRALIREQGLACERRNGALASHMSTVETARDMDIIRAALGRPRLDYYGASYGTYLGATYAALFPDRVGRFVLDGAVDPELSNEQVLLGQARGFEHELGRMVEHCMALTDCPLGSTRAAALEGIRSMLRAADGHPLPTVDDRPLTQGLAVHAIVEGLYRPEFWDRLISALGIAEDGGGRPLRNLADTYYGRGRNGYVDNSAEANSVVNCLDAQVNANQDTIPVSEFVRAAPTLGAFVKADDPCAEWPLAPHVQPPDYHLSGMPPILVVATTGDPATPYDWGVRLANEVGSGVLVTHEGDGHTAYAWGDSCVDNAVNAFMIGGDLPPEGLKC